MGKISFEETLDSILSAQRPYTLDKLEKSAVDVGMLWEVNFRNGWFISLAYAGPDHYLLEVYRLDFAAWLVVGDQLDFDTVTPYYSRYYKSIFPPINLALQLLEVIRP